ncbi:MAG: hypothetical protein K2I11_02165, partial [Bacteroides sp.]|nr:hypothetical protein [Bacteroides sp.]
PTPSRSTPGAVFLLRNEKTAIFRISGRGMIFFYILYLSQSANQPNFLFATKIINLIIRTEHSSPFFGYSNFNPLLCNRPIVTTKRGGNHVQLHPF